MLGSAQVVRLSLLSPYTMGVCGAVAQFIFSLVVLEVGFVVLPGGHNFKDSPYSDRAYQRAKEARNKSGQTACLCVSYMLFPP